MAVGYGDVYSCLVESLCVNEYLADTIRLTVINDSISKIIARSWKAQKQLRVSFIAGQQDVPYQIMPINGFVDEKKNAWVISQIKILD